MKIYDKGIFEGERALYNVEFSEIKNSVFKNGESPLKECRGLKIKSSVFEWKYPLWYCEDIIAEDTVLLGTARSGIWYTDGVTITRCTVDAPKTFRRCKGVKIEATSMFNAEETLWSCDNVDIKDVNVRGDYFGMNSTNVKAYNFCVSGNYLFDGGKNIFIENAKLVSKDAFWNCENVTVKDSVIIGEYLAWNSKNVKFINCDIESNQGLCYMDGVVLENCRLINTDLAFEFSRVDASFTATAVSVKNPIEGRIIADKIDEIIMDPALVDVSKTEIIADEKD